MRLATARGTVPTLARPRSLRRPDLPHRHPRPAPPPLA
jgi:hypothetical protein